MIFGLFRSSKARAQEHAIYAAIVAQARQPSFYTDLGVPDTLEGRYDLLMLHAFLYLHRLQNEAPAARDTAQKVFDFMFGDMDRSLREIGVGDLTVPKKIKKMAQAFYGRVAAYDAALTDGGTALTEAVSRNVFGGAGPDANAAAVARYMQRAVAELSAQDVGTLTTTGPVFPVVVAPAYPARKTG